MVRFAFALLLAAIVPGMASHASAAPDADWDVCKGPDLSDAVLAACARVAERPRETAIRRGFAHMTRSNILGGRLEIEAALVETEKAAKYLGESDGVRANRGAIFFKLGQLDRAVTELNAAIRQSPKNDLALSYRSEIRRVRGNLKDALADANSAIKVSTVKKTGNFRRRGDIYRDMTEYARAIADYNTALNLSASNGRAYFGRGSVYELQGKVDDALADYNSGIREVPKDTDIFLARAGVYRKLDRLQDALRDYDTALALRPDLDVAREARTGVAKLIDAARTPQAVETKPSRETARIVAPAETTSPQPGVPLPSAAVGTRVALVVANADYQGMRPLPNPVRDGDAVAAGLRQAGFSSVTVAQNLTRGALLQALESFAEQADKADWALVYFAGHGIEIGGVNYVLPVDAKLRTDRTANDEAVTLDRIIAAMTGAKKLRMVVLDACRDNPFQQTMRMTGATRSVGRGLSRIEPDGGTLVVYAAKHGQTAFDGADDGNSPFVTSFAKRIETPGVEIGLLFRFIRDDVLALTGGKQEPFVYGSLPGEVFYFRPPQAN